MNGGDDARKMRRKDAAIMSKMDFAGFGPVAPAAYNGDSAPVRFAFGPRFPVARTLFRAAGVFLILVASAMWFLPGSQSDADLVIMKLGVSLFFLFCGLALVMIHHSDNMPEVCFDPIRRELRILVHAADGQPHIVLCRGYDSLGRVRFYKSRIELYDFDGGLLLSLKVADPSQRAALRAQLRQLVSICN